MEKPSNCHLWLYSVEFIFGVTRFVRMCWRSQCIIWSVSYWDIKVEEPSMCPIVYLLWRINPATPLTNRVTCFRTTWLVWRCVDIGKQTVAKCCLGDSYWRILENVFIKNDTTKVQNQFANILEPRLCCIDRLWVSINMVLRRLLYRQQLYQPVRVVRQILTP